MEYKGVLDNGDGTFTAFVDVDFQDPVVSVEIDTYDLQTEAAAVVGTGLKHMTEYVDDAQFIALVKSMYNQDPPSLHEWYREQVEDTPDKKVTNLVGTINGDTVDVTFDPPAVGADSYFGYVLNVVDGTTFGGTTFTGESISFDISSLASGTDFTINIRVADSPYFDTETVTLTKP